MDETLWGIMNIMGPVILGFLLVWLVLRNRRSSKDRVDVERTERATHELYREEEQARREGTDDR